MIKVKDGYAKLINTSYTGDISLVLLSNGNTIGYDVSTNTILATIGSNVASADKLKNKVKLWGLDFDGTTDVNGSIVMTNDSSIAIKTTAGTAISLLHFPASHNFHLGYGAASNGFNTYIDGKNIYLRYGTSHTTGLLLNNSGNITIGSSDLASTSSKLYVDGYTQIKSASTPLRLVTTNTNSYSSFLDAYHSSLTSGQYYLMNFGLTASKNNSAWMGFYYSGSASTSNRISFGFTGNDNLFNIAASGNVGIGTKSPAYKLDVNGAIHASDWIYADSYLWFNKGLEGIYITKTGIYWHNTDLTWKKNLLTFNTNGYVGIDNTAPTYKLDINGAAATDRLIIKSTASHKHIEFSRAGANSITTPVDGTIRFITNGKTLGDANADLLISDGLVTVNGNILATGGFIKSGSDDTYVLLGGGGHKLLSELGTSGGPYLPLTGGTIGAGNSNAFPLQISSTNDYTGIVFANKNSTAYLRYLGAARWNVTNDGWTASYDLWHSGNFTPSNYVPLTGGVTMTGILNIATSGTPLSIHQKNGGTSYINFRTTIDGTNTDLGDLGVDTNKNLVYYKGGWKKVWHSGNDGSGSGLDADLLDGLHGSYYAAASSLGNYLPLTGGTMTGKINFSADPSDVIWIGATAETSGSKSFLDFYISDDATDAFRWRTDLYKEGGNVSFTMMQLSGSNTGNATLALTGDMTATGGVTANKFVSGNGVNDFSAGTVKLDVLNIPTSSGGTTFGPGSKGQVLKSNGTTVYWASDSNSNSWRAIQVNGTQIAGTGTNTYALNFVSGTGITVAGISGSSSAANGITITNAGVRSVTIGTGDNANKVAVDTNGTTTYLTIPYATNASKLNNLGNHTEAASSTTVPSSKFPGVLHTQGLYMTCTYNDTNTPSTFGNIINVLGTGGSLLLLGWNGTYKTGNLYYRSHRDVTTSGGWTDWEQIAYISNIPTKVSLLTNDSGFVTGGPYLPLAGGTMTGVLSMKNDVNPRISFIPSSGSSTLGTIYLMGGSSTAYSGIKYKFRQWSYTANSLTRLSYYEDYNLPETAAGLTANASYTILTTKNASVSGGGSTWGSSITVNINGVSKTLTIPSNPNVDTKVTQTITTTNANYRVLFSANANDTTETTTARKAANLLFNPSTGTLTAAGFVKSGSSDSYVLLGGGGHKAIGNATGNIPLSNGTKCVNLHADLLDGYNASDIWEYGTSLSPYNASSTGWYLFLTLVATTNDGLVDFIVSGAETGQIGIADYFHFATRPSSPSRVFNYIHLGLNHDDLRNSIYAYTSDNKTYKFYVKYETAANWTHFCKIKHVSSRGCTLTYSSTWQTAAPSGTAYLATFNGAVYYASSAGSVAWNNVTGKPTIPSVGNGTVTIKLAGSTKGSFTMNQSGNTTIELTDNNTTYDLGISDYTVKINGTTKNFVRDWGHGAANMNAVARGGRSSVGMADLSTPSGGTATAVNPNGGTSWHHFINISYTDGGAKSNSWVTQIANKAGTTDLWVRSRSGGTISDTAAWTAGWTRILTGSNYTNITDGRYIKKSGDTMTGALNFANGTWNVVGDDSAMGDCNKAGLLGIKSLNNNLPGIAFFNSSGTQIGSLYSEASVPKWSGNTMWHAGNDGSGSGLDADLLDGKHASAFATSGHTHSYIPLAGGTMSSGSAQIQRAGSSVSWYLGRSNAMIRINSYTGYNAIASMKTTNGDWSLGVYSNNILYFTYFTDTNVNGAVNTPTTQIYMNPSGLVYANSFYTTSDKALKFNILNINNSDNIPQLKEFDWKQTGKHSYGLIALELEEMGYVELVSNDGPHKTVDYQAALSLIVGKLQVKIKELEKEIEILKNK